MQSSHWGAESFYNKHALVDYFLDKEKRGDSQSASFEGLKATSLLLEELPSLTGTRFAHLSEDKKRTLENAVVDVFMNTNSDQGTLNQEAPEQFIGPYSHVNNELSQASKKRRCYLATSTVTEENLNALYVHYKEYYVDSLTQTLAELLPDEPIDTCKKHAERIYERSAVEVFRNQMLALFRVTPKEFYPIFWQRQLENELSNAFSDEQKTKAIDNIITIITSYRFKDGLSFDELKDPNLGPENKYHLLNAIFKKDIDELFDREAIVSEIKKNLGDEGSDHVAQGIFESSAREFLSYTLLEYAGLTRQDFLRLDLELNYGEELANAVTSYTISEDTVEQINDEVLALERRQVTQVNALREIFRTYHKVNDIIDNLSNSTNSYCVEEPIRNSSRFSTPYDPRDSTSSMDSICLDEGNTKTLFKERITNFNAKFAKVVIPAFINRGGKLLPKKANLEPLSSMHEEDSSSEEECSNKRASRKGLAGTIKRIMKPRFLRKKTPKAQSENVDPLAFLRPESGSFIPFEKVNLSSSSTPDPEETTPSSPLSPRLGDSQSTSPSCSRQDSEAQEGFEQLKQTLIVTQAEEPAKSLAQEDLEPSTPEPALAKVEEPAKSLAQERVKVLPQTRASINSDGGPTPELAAILERRRRLAEEAEEVA